MSVRTMLLLASIGWALASPLPATAQEQTSTSSSRGDWSVVLKLKPGTRISVTTKAVPSLSRSVVRAEPSQLTVLNLTDTTLPRSVARVLLNIASKYPEVFTQPHAGSFMEGDVYVGSQGVFRDGRKIAELREVAETIARDEIVEIRARRKGAGLFGHLGPIGGYFAGGLAGGYLGALICRCDSGFLPGMVAGGLSGGVAGYLSAVRETDQVIYGAQQRGISLPRPSALFPDTQ